MKELIEKRFRQQIDNLTSLLNSQYIDELNEAADCVVKALKNGNKILIAGNGGSAADAQHFAAELVGRFLKERRGLPAIALTTDTSILTCVGNDYAFNQIFSRQVDALAKEGDVFIGISTSGNSDNVIEAVKLAEEKKVTTIGFLGKDGGKLKDICDKSLIVPCDTTARVQEAHELSYHIICEIVDEKLAE